jgi:hypothetical protein
LSEKRPNFVASMGRIRVCVALSSFARAVAVIWFEFIVWSLCLESVMWLYCGDLIFRVKGVAAPAVNFDEDEKVAKTSPDGLKGIFVRIM